MIKLNDNYKIDFDPLNIVLYSVKKSGKDSKNPGEEYYKAVGYFGDFESLLNKLINLQVKLDGDNFEDLKQIVKKIEEFKEETNKNLLEVIQNNNSIPDKFKKER